MYVAQICIFNSSNINLIFAMSLSCPVHAESKTNSRQISSQSTHVPCLYKPRHFLDQIQKNQEHTMTPRPNYNELTLSSLWVLSQNRSRCIKGIHSASLRHHLLTQHDTSLGTRWQGSVALRLRKLVESGAVATVGSGSAMRYRLTPKTKRQLRDAKSGRMSAPTTPIRKKKPSGSRSLTKAKLVQCMCNGGRDHRSLLAEFSELQKRYNSQQADSNGSVMDETEFLDDSAIDSTMGSPATPISRLNFPQLDEVSMFSQQIDAENVNEKVAQQEKLIVELQEKLTRLEMEEFFQMQKRASLQSELDYKKVELMRARNAIDQFNVLLDVAQKEVENVKNAMGIQLGHVIASLARSPEMPSNLPLQCLEMFDLESVSGSAQPLSRVPTELTNDD